MTLPISSSNSSNPPLQVLHNVDRRMEMIINQALASESCHITTETFKILSRIQQVHPETKSELHQLLEQFDSLTLSSQGESVIINKRLATDASPFLKTRVENRLGSDSKTINLSDFDPDTIRILVQLLEGQDVTQNKLLTHAGELLALAEQLQIAEVTRMLARTKAEFPALTPPDYKALLDQAKDHNNFTMYFKLLCHTSKDTSFKEMLNAEELEIIDHAAFQNIRTGGEICIRLNSLDSISLYKKMRSIQQQRSPVDAPFKALVSPIRSSSCCPPCPAKPTA